MTAGASDERQEIVTLPIPDELMVEIFLRLPTPADLTRASATCVSFRRLTADRPFLRRYRKLHPPPLLGFLDQQCKFFYPAIAPHPSASAARAVALAADFSFSFLPAPVSDWVIKDVSDGRVLLDRAPQHGTAVCKDMVVCDPLHRRYLLLPPITHDIAASVEDPSRWTPYYSRDIFLVSPGNGDEAAAVEETSFRVVWMGVCKTRLVVFVFSSNTGQWRAIPSLSWSDLFADWSPLAETTLFYSRQHVYGCFYWGINYRKSQSKFLVLDTKTMEFSTTGLPEEARGYPDWAMVEAGEGRTGLFVIGEDLGYFIRQNNGGSSSQWQEVKTIPLGFLNFLIGNMDKFLLLYQWQSSLVDVCCFTLDIDTFQLEKVCSLKSDIYNRHAYSNFPPSLLSSPTVLSDVEEGVEKEMLEQSCAASSSVESPRSE